MTLDKFVALIEKDDAFLSIFNAYLALPVRIRAGVSSFLPGNLGVQVQIPSKSKHFSSHR